ncbi:hypothetical protein EJ02DRAFT_503840 [Clathrospora elynae]|uniref:RRM domain-containing protein n=1 Tax=Clathrospora elynae TaxID=706981 RepID=A0A6A5SMQ4_9PLEO|nr:hypothetical protein EJ02DRAFT_503840 [Clathrospora elynae]
MAVLRVLSRSRCFLPRSSTPSRLTCTAIPSIKATFLQRQFTSSAPIWENLIQTPSRGPEIALTDARVPPTGSHARSIALLRLAKRLAKPEIEAMLRTHGCNIKRIQMRVDRFTFQNSTMCFVELGSEEEVAEAIRRLHDVEVQGQKIVVKPLKADFRWGSIAEHKKTPYGTSYFYDEGANARNAIRPLVEGRRMMLSVKTPGWTVDPVNVQSKNAIRIIDQYFGKYEIESLGAIHPFYGDKQENPRLLCFLDFKTKEGADNAVRDLHDTDIEGRRTWLQPCHPAPWRTHQIGKVDPELLAELQEKGVLPKDTYEDKFVNPLPKEGTK